MRKSITTVHAFIVEEGNTSVFSPGELVRIIIEESTSEFLVVLRGKKDDNKISNVLWCLLDLNEAETEKLRGRIREAAIPNPNKE